MKTIQDIPIRAGEYEVVPYGDGYVAKSFESKTHLFIDEQERALLAAMLRPVTIARLIGIYEEQFGYYAYRRVLSLVARVLEKGFLTEPSERLLVEHPGFARFAPKRPQLRVRLPWDAPAKLLGPLASRADAPWCIGLMIAASCAAFIDLILIAPRLRMFEIFGSMYLAMVVWIFCMVAHHLLNHIFKVSMLRGKGMEAPGSGIVFWRGLPHLTVNDSAILMRGIPATVRFHAAAALWPGLASALGFALYHALPVNSTVAPLLPIWAATGLLYVFMNLSPLLPLELWQGLARKNSRDNLFDELRAFAHRKFLRRVIADPAPLPGSRRRNWFFVYGLAWVCLAFWVARIGIGWSLEPLWLVVSHSPDVADRIAAAAFIGIILAPLIALALGVLITIGYNLVSLVARPIDRFLTRLSRIFRKPVLTLEDRIRCLGRMAIFAALPEDVLGQLAPKLKVRYFPAGRTVVWQGERGDTFYMIHEGRVRVIYENDLGMRSELAALTEYDSFGEIALLENVPRVASVQATKPTVCLAMSRSLFLPFVAAHQEALGDITRILQWSAFLKSMMMFSGTPAIVMRQVIMDSHEREHFRGETILAKGSPGEECFVLRTGQATVWRDYGTPTARQIAALKAGDFLGEMALFKRTDRMATVIADMPCKVLVIPREMFSLILRANLASGLLMEDTVQEREAALNGA